MTQEQLKKSVVLDKQITKLYFILGCINDKTFCLSMGFKNFGGVTTLESIPELDKFIEGLTPEIEQFIVKLLENKEKEFEQL